MKCSAFRVLSFVIRVPGSELCHLPFCLRNDLEVLTHFRQSLIGIPNSEVRQNVAPRVSYCHRSEGRGEGVRWEGRVQVNENGERY